MQQSFVPHTKTSHVLMSLKKMSRRSGRGALASNILVSQVMRYNAQFSLPAYMGYLEAAAPNLLKRETGRLLKTLAMFPQGLTRTQLLSVFYERYATASYGWQNSMRQTLEKTLQRSRGVFEPCGLTVVYDKTRNVYVLTPAQKTC